MWLDKARALWRKSYIWTHPSFSLFLVGLVLRLFRIGKQSFWFDEAYTVLIAKMPLQDELQALLADGVHPPLHYLLAKVLLVFGDNEIVMRLPSALLGALAVPLVYQLGKRYIGETAGLLSAALLAFNPFHLWYSQEARMYATLTTLAVAVMYLFLRLLEGQRSWTRVGFVLLSALGYCTHYFFLVLPLLQFFHLILHFRLLWKSLRAWILAQAIALLPLLLWIRALLGRDAQYFGIGWIPKPIFMDFPLTFANFTAGLNQNNLIWGWVGLVIATLLVFSGLSVSWKRSVKTALVIWAFFPPIFTLLLSLQRPLYIDRFLIISLPAWLLLVGSGFLRLRGKLAWAVGILVCAGILLATIHFVWLPGQQKEDWREAGRILSSAQAEEAIIVRVLQVAVPLQLYYEGEAPIWAMEVNRRITSLTTLSQGYEGVWLVYWNAMADAHRVALNPSFDSSQEQDPIAHAWVQGQGPEIVERIDLPGVTIFHFDLHP